MEAEAAVEDLAGLSDLVASLEAADEPPQSALARVRELLPTQPPPLLSILAPPILRLAARPAPAVRRAALEMAELLAHGNPQTLPLIIPPLRRGLSDADAAVVRRAILTAAAIFRPAVGRIARLREEELARESGAAVWEELCELRDAILAMLDPAAAKAVPQQVLTGAIKFAESVVLAFTPSPSPPTPDSEGARTHWSVAQLPAAHPLLAASPLLAVAERALDRMLALLTAPPSSSLLTMLTSLLLALGREREALLARLVPALCALQAAVQTRAVKGLQPSQVGNVQQALKAAMLSLSKLPGVAADTQLEEMLAASLQALGATGAALLGKRAALEAEAAASRKKAAPAEASGAEGEAAEAEAAAAAGRTEGKAEATEEEQDGEGKSAAAAVAPPPGAELPPVGDPQLEAILSQLSSEVVADLVIAAMAYFPAKPEEGGRAAGEGAAAARAEEAAQVKLSDAEYETLELTVIEQLLSEGCEQALAAAHRSQLRADLLGRMASLHPLGSTFHSALLDHLTSPPSIEACRERVHLALSWLSHEHARLAAAPIAADSARYDEVAIALLAAYRERLPANERLWTTLLLEAPRLPPAVWELVQHDLSDEREGGRRTLGLATARELLLQRDECHAQLLPILLECADSASESLRTNTIRLLAHQIFAARPAVGGVVRAHARARLVHGVTLADEAAARHAMLLYVALCAREPQLLQGLLDGYAVGTAEAQAAIRSPLGSLLAHVLPDELTPVLLQAFNSLAEGAEPLALLILETLAKQPPLPRPLVDGILELPRSTLLDARLLLPVLPSLDAAQAEACLPLLLFLPQPLLKSALVSLMHAEPAPLPLATLLLQLHVIDVDALGLPLKAQIDAVQICIAERPLVTHEIMAHALSQIVEQEPLPLMCVRTIMQALVYWPTLTEFAMVLLQRLLDRRVWTMPRLWQGFVKCCQMAMPHSFQVLLQLPRPQLVQALEQQTELKDGLISYAATHLSSIPQEALEVLGLTEEE